ncbi:unnamed protein product [Rotaria sp. Silwood2]|nr:unnamed protein product [Rotaria sp. Silwood2]
MSSDESFNDEYLDKSSPIRMSDRVLRSSSVSTSSDQRMPMNFINETYSSTSSNTKRISNENLTSRSIFYSASDHEVVERSSQIFDVSHLKECIDTAHICPGGRLELIIDAGKSFGLFHKNGLKCSICNKITDLTNFPAQPARHIQEPNQRLYAASAISGIGYDTTQFVLSLLGISVPSRSNFYNQVYNLYDQLFDFAHADFLTLINEIRNNAKCDSKTILNLTVSLDGTWKKRGHHSMYGVVFLIDADSGFCLDFETLSTRCGTCEYKSHQKKCSKTWDGSAGGMEKEGAKKIFERSLEKGVRYSNMISDGDSSAYETVKYIYANMLLNDRSRSISHENRTTTDLLLENEHHDNHNSNSFLLSDEYKSYIVTKEDCINHVKKRVSSYLKTLKNRHTGFEEEQEEHLTTTKHQKGVSSSINKRRRRRCLADGKPYGGGAGRMTKSMEKKLSDYYGLAIRYSSEVAKDMNEDDAVALMERNCRASFMHNIKQSDRELQHLFCPSGRHSWCSYQRDKYVPITEKIDSIKDTKRLDMVFLHILTPMIDKLTDASLLQRCLRASTQNANESINSVLWSILPKTKYHGYRSVRGASAIASIFFNRGRSGLLKFFDQVGISVTEELFSTLLGKDNKRIEKAEYNMQQKETIKKQKQQQRLQSQLAEDE